MSTTACHGDLVVLEERASSMALSAAKETLSLGVLAEKKLLTFPLVGSRLSMSFPAQEYDSILQGKRALVGKVSLRNPPRMAFTRQRDTPDTYQNDSAGCSADGRSSLRHQVPTRFSCRCTTERVNTTCFTRPERTFIYQPLSMHFRLTDAHRHAFALFCVITNDQGPATDVLWSNGRVIY